MIVNEKFSHKLPAPVVTNMVEYLVTPDFQQSVMGPYRRDTRRRFLISATPFGPLITIQHSGWYARSNDPAYMVTLACVGTMGLLDVMLLSHEGTHDTSLLWFMVPKAHIYKSAEIGVVVSAGIPNKKDAVKKLADADGLLILADQRLLSTVVVYADAYAYETY